MRIPATHVAYTVNNVGIYTYIIDSLFYFDFQLFWSSFNLFYSGEYWDIHYILGSIKQETVFMDEG